MRAGEAGPRECRLSERSTIHTTMMTAASTSN
jgi:hypothetical protein